jgi:hypothetical protein
MLRRTTGRGAMPIAQGLNSFSEVAEQMPAVGDLDRAWSALADPAGIGAGAITGDDFDAGTIPQPGGDGRGLAVGQQIDHLVRLEIDEDGPVSTAALPGPVIDAQDARRRHRLRVRPGGCQTQQCVGTCRNRDPCSQPCTRFAAECEAKMMLEFSQSSGSAPGTTRDARQALRKSPADATAIAAVKAARRDLDRDWPSLPR